MPITPLLKFLYHPALVLRMLLGNLHSTQCTFPQYLLQVTDSPVTPPDKQLHQTIHESLVNLRADRSGWLFEKPVLRIHTHPSSPTYVLIKGGGESILIPEASGGRV